MGNILDTVTSVIGINEQSKANKDANRAAFDAADPRRFINIGIPGLDYGDGSAVVNLPSYPSMPQYGDVAAPLLPAVMQGATRGEQGMGTALDQSHASILALLNPSNPIFKTLAAEEEAQINDSFLRGVSDLRRMNQRSRAQGRGAFLDDDAVMSQVLGNARDASLQAKKNARTTLGDVSNRLQGIASGYGSLGNQETARRNAYRSDLATRLGQMRTDYNTRINQQRSDVSGNFENQRDNILKAIDLYGRNKASIDKAKTNQVTTKNQGRAAELAGYRDFASNMQDNITSLMGFL